MNKSDELITELSGKLKPVKALQHPFLTTLKWAAGATLYLAMLIAYATIRQDFGAKLSSPLFSLEIFLLCAMVLTSGLSVAVLSFPDVYQKRWAMYAPLATLVLFCAVLALEWLEDMPPSLMPNHSGLECLVSIVCYSLAPACFIFYRLRKMANTHGALAGFVAILGAYSIGCLALRVSENTNSIRHLVEWHYVPMLLFSTLGLWLGKKFLKW